MAKKRPALDPATTRDGKARRKQNPHKAAIRALRGMEARAGARLDAGPRRELVMGVLVGVRRVLTRMEDDLGQATPPDVYVALSEYGDSAGDGAERLDLFS